MTQPTAQSSPQPTAIPPQPIPELTAREYEVAAMLAAGQRNKDIAIALKISVKTIDTHRGHILKKLDLDNNVLLAHLFIRRGLLEV